MQPNSGLKPKRDGGIVFSIMYPGKRWSHCGPWCYAPREGAVCKCICGGINHGVGKAKAIINSKAIIHSIKKALDPDTRIWVCDEVKQITFEEYANETIVG